MQEQENGMDMLEVLSLVAQNIKLLIFVPFVAGLIGLGISFTLPKSYTSRAVLSLPVNSQSGAIQTFIPTPVQAASMMLTPVVLDPVIVARNLGANKSLQAARTDLEARTKTVVGKDLLLRLDVKAKTPEEAQATANAVIDAWLKTTYPTPRDRERMIKRLDYTKLVFESVRQQLGKLVRREGNGLSTVVRNDLGGYMVGLGEIEARYFAEISSIERSIDGLSRNVIVQEPTLSLEPSSPKKTWIATGSALVCEVLVILWILIGRSWSLAAQNPASQEKMERLRRIFRFNKD